MTNRIKELFHKISNCKHFYIPFIVIIIINIIIVLLDDTFHEATYITDITILLFFFITSFKNWNIETIKKNKIINIVFSNFMFVFMLLWNISKLVMFLINSIFELHVILFVILHTLVSAIMMLLGGSKISSHFEKKIIK